MNWFLGRARVLVVSLLLAAPLVALGSVAPSPVSADPIINPPSVPCYVPFGQPMWLNPPPPWTMSTAARTAT